MSQTCGLPHFTQPLLLSPTTAGQRRLIGVGMGRLLDAVDEVAEESGQVVSFGILGEIDEWIGEVNGIPIH